MTDRWEHAGVAALSICESLLLCLRDEGVLQWHAVNDLLEDAAVMYDEQAREHPEAADRNNAIAQIIRSMLLENSVKT